jgi:uncharacterized protein (DUF302 family)
MRTVVSSSGYSETLRLVLDGIGRRGLTKFARIDHAAAAREAGMDLTDEMVVTLGHPRAYQSRQYRLGSTIRARSGTIG